MKTNQTSPPKEESNQESEDLRFECEQLRNEVLQNDVQTLQIMAAMLVMTSALMSFAFTQTLDAPVKAILFFLAEIIAFVGMYLNIGRLKNTFKVGAYIKTFIEPKTKCLKWETRLEKFREQSPGPSGIGFLIVDQRLIYLVIIIANSLLGCYYLFEACSRIQKPILMYVLLVVAVSITLSVFLSLWRHYTAISKGRTELFDQIWISIRDSE